MQKCSTCGESRALGEFYEKASRCKACYKDRYRANKEYYRNNSLKYKFGITLKEKRKMWKEQRGKCFLCNRDMLSTYDCNVDHDHETNVIRKILCRACNNWMAGVDNEEWLQKAISYRKQFQINS